MGHLKSAPVEDTSTTPLEDDGVASSDGHENDASSDVFVIGVVRREIMALLKLHLKSSINVISWEEIESVDALIRG